MSIPSVFICRFAPIKLEPWSDLIILHAPRIAINRASALRKLAVSMAAKGSRCIALEGKQTIINTQTLLVLDVARVLLLTVMWNGPKQSIPTLEKGAVSSSLSGGKSAMSWVQGCPRKRLHVMHWRMIWRIC